MSIKFVPHEYQETGIKFLIEMSFTGLLLDPGLGKTSITLAAFKILQQLGFVKAALVIAPLKPCYSVWPEEVLKWNEFKHLSVGILHGDKKADVLREKHDIYTINPEGLKWLRGQLTGKKVLPFDMLVIDESTRFKHTNNNRAKLLYPMLPFFKRRVILTGSPAPNGLLDLFGQVYCMDLGATFGPYISHYRSKYFYVSQSQTCYKANNLGGIDNFEVPTRFVPKEGAADEIYSRLAPRVLRMAAEDYLQLPPLVNKTLWVDLPKQARQLYDQLESALVLEFKKGRVTAANAGVALNKCRQLANGGVYLDREEGESETKREWKLIHDAKTEALCDLVEELSGQEALVAYDFNHDLARAQPALSKLLGEAVPHIGKGVKATQAAQIVKRWNAGELPVLLGQPKSMSHGLNMQQRGRAVIWYGLTYDYEDYFQFIRRIWRQGQTGRVFVYHILARDTVDEAVLASLQAKRRTETALLDALKAYWVERGLL